MKLQLVYEVTRLPKAFPVRLGVLRQVRGGLYLIGGEGFSVHLPITDLDAQLVDDEENGVVEVLQPDARWVFNVLGLSNWKAMEPFLSDEFPDFKSDAEVNAYFFQRITKA